MSLEEKIIRHIHELPESKKAEVLNFPLSSLSLKSRVEQSAMLMDLE